MRKLGIGAALAGLLGVTIAGGCGSSGSRAFDGADGGGAFPDGGGFSDGATSDAFAGCATGTFAGKQAPAAMIFVLDGGGTMATGGKYATAQQAIVRTMDFDAFDTMYLGLELFPTTKMNIPAGKGDTTCQTLASIGVQLTCGVPFAPQEPLSPAGTDKSNAGSGVRRRMYDKLVASAPQPGSGDGKPSYEAIRVAIEALQALSINGKRMLFFITDGGASCGLFGSRPTYVDSNGCPDWENPQNIVDLVKNAHDDAQKPVNTIIVGVPGANTTGSDPAREPPYHMKNALSAIGFAGSPETADPTCDGKTYTQAGGDPAKPCHFDMSGTFTAKMIEEAIAKIRGSLVGCIFDLPTPPQGAVDRAKVNVEYDTGSGAQTPKKRSNPNDACASDGCWDYTADGRVELLGKACADLKSGAEVRVRIVVGCQTIVK